MGGEEEEPEGGGSRSQKMAEAGVSWGPLVKRWGLGADGSGLRRGMAFGKRNCLYFCILGTLLADAGSQDHRWGLKGKGLRLPGEGSERSARGQRGRADVIGEGETPRTVEECRRGRKAGGRREGRPWRSDEGGGRRAVKHRAVRTWEACSQRDSGLGGDGSKR